MLSPEWMIDPARFVIAGFAVLASGLLAYAPMGQRVLLPRFWGFSILVLAPLFRRLDRLARRPGDLAFRAVLAVIFTLVFAVIMARFTLWLDQALSASGAVIFLALMGCIKMGGIWQVMRDTASKSDPDTIKSPLAGALARTYELRPFSDAFTVRRAGIAHGALAFDQMMVLPVMGFVLFGITGTFYVAAMAAMRFYLRLTPPHTPFADTFFQIEKISGFVPGWIAGVLLWLAAFIAPRTGITRGLPVLHPDQRKIRYENGGFALAMMAWGLVLTLGGPMVRRDGMILNWSWCGPESGSARAGADKLRAALYWVVIASILCAAVLFSAGIWARVL